MLLDARRISDQNILSTDVCIIGAGPAGITIARELNGQGFNVLLLESGGFEHDPEIHALASGTYEGDPYCPPGIMRDFQYGGTANYWGINLADSGEEKRCVGVRYVPLDPIDFEKRDWIPYSGWPIARQDLDPYYERAHRIGQSGPYLYDVNAWESAQAKQIPFQGNRVKTQIFHFGFRTAFTQDYRWELEQSKNVTLVIYATVLQLETDDLAKNVTGLRVGSLAGNEFRVEANVVISAQGALETDRLLLLSNKQQSCGLGNGNDLVGRFLMDHPIVRPGVLIPTTRQIMNQLDLYDVRWVRGSCIVAKPVLTEEVMRQEHLLNINTAIFPRPVWVATNFLRAIFPEGMHPNSAALKSAQALKQMLREKKISSDLLKEVKNIPGGLDDLIYWKWRSIPDRWYRHFPLCSYNVDNGGWSALGNKPKKFVCFDLLHITEQAPDPNNRIKLSGDRDAFGLPKIVIQWRYNDIDKRSAKRATQIFADEFKAAGVGTMRFELDYGELCVRNPSIHHPMGTTRMHDSPSQGVVDADCKVHGIANLFIASSSVFPTGGYANPTLTILALALRVADHVKLMMESGQVTHS